MEQAHAHSLSSDFILADGLKGASIGGVDKAGDKQENYSCYQENIPHIVNSWNILDAQRAIGKALRIGNNDTDNFGKAQCGNGQIVAT